MQRLSPVSRANAVMVLGCSLAFGVLSVGAQIPSRFTNLRVLPKDLPQRQLLDTMRGFASALDVDCSHCHVGTDPDDLSTFDFASDEKRAKRTARVMIEMVRAINEQHLPRTGKKAPEVFSVGCVTCHNGKVRPETLGDALAAAMREGGGADAALKRYRELRERYYGRSAYDFGPDSLVHFARRLAGEGKMSASVAVLELNLDHHPGSAWTLLTLGETHLQMEDRSAALATFRRLLAVDPGNSWAVKRVDELGGKPAGRDAPPRDALAISIQQLRYAVGRWSVATEFLNDDGTVAQTVSGTYEFEWVVPDRVVSGTSEIPELKQRSGILFYVSEKRNAVEMVTVGADGQLWTMTGRLGEETRYSQTFQSSEGREGQLRFIRFNVDADRFESRMEHTEDGGKSWKPGNHQVFRRQR